MYSEILHYMETRVQFHTLANLHPRNVRDPQYQLNGRVGGREPMLKFLLQYIYIYIYLITNSMVQSPSWDANWFAASQEIPHISRNPKVHYRTHKRPTPVSIISSLYTHIPPPGDPFSYIYIYIYIYKQTEIKYRCIKPRFDTDINIHAALTDILVENIYFSFRKCMLQLILFIPAGNNNRKTHHCQLSVRHINVMLHTHTHNTYQ